MGKSMGNPWKLWKIQGKIHGNYGKLMKNPWKKTRIDGTIYGTSINHHKSMGNKSSEQDNLADELFGD